MNETQQLLEQLREKGWTWSAVADEIGFQRGAVDRWYRGERVPHNPALVNPALADLVTRKRVPKQRRYAAPSITA